MTRETPQFGLRMPPDLRAAMEKEASTNGRSINAEICARLWASVGDQEKGAAADPAVKEPDPAYAVLPDNERQMLALFRRWPAEKQLSFLVLFK